MLRIESVLAQTGQARTTHYECVAAGTMTSPIKIGPRASAWPDDEVDAIVKARIGGATDDDLRRLVTRLHAERKALAAQREASHAA
ncbi:helix-turn-helix transcriptional regulator [Roseateles saccharophilus]|uniref:helix-turn-helix transcriptional regulator n=1 Tax=Roseateles saccharophilus TaxID=304 RepID=UPI0039EE3EFA